MFASSNATRVLGIDPGLTRCGFAVLDARRSERPVTVTMGVITTPKDAELPQRLAELRTEIVSLLDQFEPDVVSVERVFFQVNVRTAMSVGQASGIVLCEAASRGCLVAQYTPNQVKDAVAGDGSADKGQVQRMVQRRLGLERLPTPADAADAAALALCHLSFAPFVARAGRSMVAR